MDGPRATRFIGRAGELGALTRALDEAVAGHPRIAVVTGDRAVGKTMLAGELLTLAKAAGFRTFAGACHEDITIPYLPIASALRPLTDLAARWPDALSADRDPGTAERMRLQLFLDVTRSVLDEATRQPIALVIEDVHWADPATAELLTHLCRAIAYEGQMSALPIVVVLTSRRALEKQMPFFLERLARDPHTLNVDVGPFTQEETHAFIASTFGAHPPADLLIDLFDATAGHPLLLRSAVARLVAQGAAPDIGGRFGLRPAGTRLTAGNDLDRELRALVDEVDDDTRRLLVIAAFVGDGHTIERLRELAGGPIERSVATAIDAGLLDVADDGSFRFVHPELRHALKSEPDAHERQRLHRLVAATLERRGSEDDALEIATHLAQAGNADPQHVLHWAVIAGDRNAAAGGWSQAMRAYEIAIDHAGSLGEPALGSLLVKAGVAAWFSHDPSGCEHLKRAADLAQARGDAVSRAEALLALSRFHTSRTAVRESVFPDEAEFEEAVADLGDHHAPLRANLLANIADMAATALDLERSRALAQRAEAVTLGASDDVALARVHLALGLASFASMELDAAYDHYARAAEISDRAGDVFHRDTSNTRLGMIHAVRGEFARASELLERSRLDQARHGFWGENQIACGALANLALAEGRFHDVERLAAEALSLYRVDEYSFIPGLTYPPLALGRSLRGDVAGAARAIADCSATGVGGMFRYDAVLSSWAGDEDTVRARIAQRAWPPPAQGSLFALDLACAQIEVAAQIGAPDLAVAARDALRSAYDRGVVFSASGAWCVPRLLAECELLTANADGAERLFDEAEQITAACGARLEQARSRLGQARTKLLRSDRTGAIADANRAAARFDELGALVASHWARAITGRTDVVRVATSTSFRVLLVTDLQDSTGLNVSVGDERYLTLLNEHDGIIRRRLREFDGVEFQHRGDGIAAWFTKASDAVSCALAIREDMESATGVHPELPLVVRLGIAAGEPIGVGAELFGLSVVVACRICDIAEAGQILVAEEVAGLARGKNFTFANKGAFALKGLPAPTTLYEAAAG